MRGIELIEVKMRMGKRAEPDAGFLEAALDMERAKWIVRFRMGHQAKIPMFVKARRREQDRKSLTDQSGEAKFRGFGVEQVIHGGDDNTEIQVTRAARSQSVDQEPCRIRVRGTYGNGALCVGSRRGDRPWASQEGGAKWGRLRVRCGNPCRPSSECLE